MTPKDAAIPVEGDNGAAQYEWAIGPIDGITTVWYAAPGEITVPVGTTFRLKCGGSRSAGIQWTNAVEVARADNGSIAECHIGVPGRHEISVAVEPNVAGGTGKRDPTHEVAVIHTCLVNAVDVAVDQIGVNALDPRVQPMTLTEKSSNYETMRAFLTGEGQQVISQLRRVGPNRYRTAINRDVAPGATLIDPRFASLIETRITGERPTLGSELVRLHKPGRYSVSVGPPARAKSFDIETYNVTMTRLDPVQDDVPVNFVATTDPPGYEDEITWIASTKYGEAHPVVGSGPTFTVTFRSTGGQSPWFGVRADNAAFTQDAPSSPCVAWAFPYDGLDHRFAAASGDNVFTAAATNVDSVAVVAQTAGLQDIAGSLTTLRPGTTIVVNYTQAVYYVIRPPVKPNPKPIATGSIAAGGLPLACVQANGDFNCVDHVVVPVKSSDKAGIHTFRVIAKNANGASECPVILHWTSGPGSGSEFINPGESGGFTVNNAPGNQLVVTYRCAGPSGKCRATLSMMKTGTSNDLDINESWTAQVCGGSSEIIHTGLAPGSYELSVSAKSGGVASDCPVSFSWSVPDLPEEGIVIPAGGGPTAIGKTIGANQQILFLVKCNGQANETCRVTVNVISTP